MATPLPSLQGRVVVITGGARGIGRALASALVGRGARVAIGDIEAPLAQDTARALGPDVLGLALDVTSRTSFDTFLSEVEARLGPLDVLINNAGITPVGALDDEPDEVTQQAVDVNVSGVILGSKLALERFRPRGQGHIVNMASLAGKGGYAGGATYCATKHAVVGLSEALRAELRDTGIRVSLVMPATVNTEVRSNNRNPGGLELVQLDEVAGAILEGLQTGRFEVYVPKSLAALVRVNALLPRKAFESIRYGLRPWIQARRTPPRTV